MCLVEFKIGMTGTVKTTHNSLVTIKYDSIPFNVETMLIYRGKSQPTTFQKREIKSLFHIWKPGKCYALLDVIGEDGKRTFAYSIPQFQPAEDG